MTPDLLSWGAPRSQASGDRYATSFGARGNGTTDDTAAVQSAINDAAAAAALTTNGWADVVLPAGYNFLLGQITPKSGVRLWCYGATITPNLASVTNGLFFYTANLTNWEIRGGNWAGTGAETHNQLVFGSSSGTQCTDVGFFDMRITNWAPGPLYIRNPTRARAQNNTIIGGGGGPEFYNAINFVNDAGAAINGQEIIATGNFIEGCTASAIAYGNTGANVSGDCRLLIANNVVSCAGQSAGALDVEFTTASTGQFAEFIIANNIVNQATANPAWGISVAEIASNVDPAFVRKVVVSGNIVTSNARGINVNASDAVVTGNFSNAPTFALNIERPGTIAITADQASNTTLSNVAGGANAVNGSPIVGTGLTAGTFLVSGAGTATWTISQPATATTVGQALTVSAQNKNITVSGNLIHTAASPAGNPVRFNQIRNATFTGNRVVVDAGSANSVDAVSFNLCGWIACKDNEIEYAPEHGIIFNAGNDVEIVGNRVYNCAEGTNSGRGIQIAGVSGALAKVADNTILDDRAVPRMQFGINVSTILAGILEALRNRIQGAVTSPINGVFFRRRDNTVTAGASEGRATLVAGTVTVNTAEILASDNVHLTVVSPAGTRGVVQLGTITAGTSFVINSIQPGTASTIQTLDTSIVYWRIDH